MSPSNPHTDVLRRIKRGLSGYVSYLSACGMKESFSEYILYEPILRIFTACGYVVKCEVECPDHEKPRRGDKKRLDFVGKSNSHTFALEVKWAKKKDLNIENDCGKLTKYRDKDDAADCFLCVFGRKSHIKDIKLNPPKFREVGKAVYAEFGQTKFGCRIYRLNDAARDGASRRLDSTLRTSNNACDRHLPATVDPRRLRTIITSMA